MHLFYSFSLLWENIPSLLSVFTIVSHHNGTCPRPSFASSLFFYLLLLSLCLLLLLSPILHPHPHPSSPPLPPLLSGRATFCFITLQTFLNLCRRKQGTTSAGGGVEGWGGGEGDSGLRRADGGGDTAPYKQMSQGPKQQAGDGGEEDQEDGVRNTRSLLTSLSILFSQLFWILNTWLFFGSLPCPLIHSLLHVVTPLHSSSPIPLFFLLRPYLLSTSS